MKKQRAFPSIELNTNDQFAMFFMLIALAMLSFFAGFAFCAYNYQK